LVSAIDWFFGAINWFVTLFSVARKSKDTSTKNT
jgi:hypothetical protein